MRYDISRRQVLKGLVVGVAVVGFNPISRLWITDARAGGDPFLLDLPKLDGQLLTDLSSREAVGRDIGGLVFETPHAVLRPGSIRDIQRMVRFCREHEIPVAARGQAHTVFGQSQVQDGLSIDMGPLNTIHSITDNALVVDAGAVWKDVLAETTRQNLTLPVLTAFLGLSVGGTLSVGGVSGVAFNKGAQVDHVLELQVVDGRGNRLICSPHANPGLFNAVLAGLGQCAIIVRATIRLVPVGTHTRYTVLTYMDQTTWLHDLRELIARGESDGVWGSLRIDPSRASWFYEINAASYYTPPTSPSSDLFRGLSFDPTAVSVVESTYYEYQTMVDRGIDYLRSIGLWDGVAHPWFDVFLGDSRIEEYLAQVLPTLNPVVDVGFAGFVLLFPLQTRNLRRPLLRVPDEPLVFLFDILTSANAPGLDPAYNEMMIQRNRRLFDLARSMGGTKYNIAAIPFSRTDWMQQFGPAYSPFAFQKAIHDPARILTPGPGIF